MPEVYMLEAGVRLRTDEAKKDLNNLAKSVEDRMKKIAIAMPSLGGAAEKFAGGMRAGIFGGAAPGGAAGGFGKMLGTMTLMLGAMQVITTGVKKIANTLSEISPALAGTFDIMKRSFYIMVRPFADFMATMLRPLVVWMLKFAIEFLKFIGTLKSGKSITPGEAATGIVGGAVAGGVLGSPFGPAGIAVGAALGAIPTSLWVIYNNINNMVEPWKTLTATIVGIITGVGVEFGLLVVAGATLAEALGLITGPIGWAAAAIGIAVVLLITHWDEVVAFVKGMAATLKVAWDNAMTLINSGISWVSDELSKVWTGIIDTLTSIWTKVKDAYLAVSNALSNVGSAIMDAARKIPVIGKYIPAKQFGGMIPETGPYLMHAGEKVIPRNEASRGAPNFTITINNPSVRSDNDIDKLISEISRRMQIEMRRGTGYMGGF
jgi:hypothetical protein